MAHRYTPTQVKTYATYANAVKAVEKVCGPNEPHFGSSELKYVIAATAEGRFYPVFVGQAALQQQMFQHFAVLAV